MKLDNKTESNLDALFAAAHRCLSDNKKEINNIDNSRINFLLCLKRQIR